MVSSLYPPNASDVLINVVASALQQPGTSTRLLQDFLIKLTGSIPSFQPLVVTDFGAKGNGIADDTAAFQKAINQAAANGGATVIAPTGQYLLGKVTFPATSMPVTLAGQGPSTVFLRNGDIADGAGMFDILGSNVTLQDFLIDGQVTIPAGLFYNQDFLGINGNDPMANSLTKNTSIWLHSGTSGLTLQRVTIQHTGGYALLLDANQGEISDVKLLFCRFLNNRPSLFGKVGGQAIYGSWNGGVMAHGDGRTAVQGSTAKRIMVLGCEWMRNTGNCFWQHLWGLNELHEDIQCIANYFLDCGLDGILMGGVTGGSVTANVFRRIGYVCTDDTSKSIPRWLQDLNATAIDSAGIVKNVPYQNNSILSSNGGGIDTDSHGQSSISGNVIRVPYPGEVEYDEDSIAISGPNNNGSYSYGLNANNSSDTPFGGANFSVVGNTFINLRAGSIRLFAARRCIVSGNLIVAPGDSVSPPVSLGPVGSGINQRCYDNKITANDIDYSPVSAAPAIFEDDEYSQFLSTEKNTVCNNVPITGNGLATEFEPSPHSGSVHYLETVWFT